MLTREATYEDYGFSEEEDKKFNEFCRKLEMRDKISMHTGRKHWQCSGRH